MVICLGAIDVLILCWQVPAESLRQVAFHSDSSDFFAFPSQHPGGPAGNFGFAVDSASDAAGTQKTASIGTQWTPGGAWLTPGGP